MTQRELLDELYYLVHDCRVGDLQTFKNDLLDGLEKLEDKLRENEETQYD